MLQIMCIAVSALTIIMGIKAILSPSGIQLTQNRRLEGGFGPNRRRADRAPRRDPSRFVDLWD
jgi:hypothetical protein